MMLFNSKSQVKKHTLIYFAVCDNYKIGRKDEQGSEIVLWQFVILAVWYFGSLAFWLFSFRWAINFPGVFPEGIFFLTAIK
jgi:hypothetical protein